MKTFVVTAQQINALVSQIENIPWKYAHPLMEALKSIVNENQNKAEEKNDAS